MPFNFSKFSPSLAVSREGLLPPGVHDLTRAGDKSVFLEGTSHTRHNTTTKKNKSSEGKIKKTTWSPFLRRTFCQPTAEKCGPKRRRKAARSHCLSYARGDSGDSSYSVTGKPVGNPVKIACWVLLHHPSEMVVTWNTFHSCKKTV